MVFFFFKQKTAYEMRISDWSSDVCSSDLDQQRIEGAGQSSGQAGQFREAAVGGGEQSPVEGRRDQAALHQPVVVAELERSAERRVGKECVSTCRSRWSLDHYKQKNETHQYKRKHIIEAKRHS